MSKANLIKLRIIAGLLVLMFVVGVLAIIVIEVDSLPFSNPFAVVTKQRVVFATAHLDDPPLFMGSTIYNETVIAHSQYTFLILFVEDPREFVNLPSGTLCAHELEALNVMEWLASQRGETTAFTQKILDLPSGDTIIYLTNGNLYLILFRLAGACTPNGCPEVYHETPDKFWDSMPDDTGQVRLMKVDNTFTYTAKIQLISDIEYLFRWSGGTRGIFHIQTADTSQSWGASYSDHPDHIYMSKFAQAAFQISSVLTEVQVYEYMSYASQLMPPNLSQSAHDIKLHMIELMPTYWAEQQRAANATFHHYLWTEYYRPLSTTAPTTVTTTNTITTTTARTDQYVATVRAGQTTELRFPTNPSTGCSWWIQSQPSNVQITVSSGTDTNIDCRGIPGCSNLLTIYTIRAPVAGDFTIEFRYGHAWATDEYYTVAVLHLTVLPSGVTQTQTGSLVTTTQTITITKTLTTTTVTTLTSTRVGPTSATAVIASSAPSISSETTKATVRIPGFPIEGILVGLVVALCMFSFNRFRRRN